MKKTLLLCGLLFVLAGCGQKVQEEISNQQPVKKTESVKQEVKKETFVENEVVKEEVKKEEDKTVSKSYLEIKEWNIKMPVLEKNDLTYKIVDNKTLKIYSKELDTFSKSCSNEELYTLSKNEGVIPVNYGDGAMKQFGNFYIATSMPPICDNLDEESKDKLFKILNNFKKSFNEANLINE